MQNVNKGHSGANRKRRKRAESKPGNGPVTTISVDLLLWAMVKDIVTDGTVLILDTDKIVVCNSRKHREHMRKIYADV